MNKIIRISLFLFSLLIAQSSFAILHLVLTQGVNSAIPITVVPFAEPSTPTATNVSQVIAADLTNSGRFTNLEANDTNHQPHQASDVQLNYWQAQGANYLIVGNVQSNGNDNYSIAISIVDVFKNHAKNNSNPIVFQRTFNSTASNLRATAHQISDVIYQQLLGERGVFSTKIAYILFQTNNNEPTYKLMIADYDGANAAPILVSHQPIMSPAWSPDGKQMAYVSFESGFPQIYISNIQSGKRRLITSFTGINGAPAFSPNGQQLALVLSKGQQPNIYTVNLQSGSLQQLTRAYAINTEPSWAPNGNNILFTSDRGGSPQIYRYNLNTRATTRVTFSGDYNAHASYTPNASSIVMLHRGKDSQNQFVVAMQNLQSGALHLLTQESSQSPSLAPNGSMVIYATKTQGGAGELAMVSIDGRVHLRLPTDNGDVREPAWSPYLS